MLTKEELQKIIEKFDEDELKSQGTFGIFQYGGGSDESFIRANKEGLELFAIELLKSAKEIVDLMNTEKKNTIPFENDENWIDEKSDTFIEYIEIVSEKQNLKSEHKSTFVNTLMQFGFVLVGIIIVISFLVGLVTVFNWLF